MNSNSFQTIFLVLFGAAAVFGVLVFSGAINIGSKDDQPGALGTVTIWGTVNNSSISNTLEEFNNTNKSFVVRYVQKSSNTFDQELLEALASGVGPDMVIFPQDLIYHYVNRITIIPYSSYPLATFKNNFATASEVFVAPSGIMAFPLTIDPFMMYYNRTILDSNGIINPPKTWRELGTMVPTLTTKDSSNQITKSAVALGQTSNIPHMKDILTTLFMQLGNPIVSLKTGSPEATLNPNGATSNLGTALDFYISFADPQRSVYTWNKSFPNAQSAFSSERTAFYFGYASELGTLFNRNPNQNLFVTTIPQAEGTNLKLTNARVMGIAILASSKNPSTAFTAASLLATGNFAERFSNALGIVPARRDLLGKRPTDAFSPIFYDSALFAKSWLDPSPVDTDNIFANMVSAVLANTMTVEDAIKDANAKMGLLLYK